MSKKLIWSDVSETHVVKVYRDSEWQEYVARLIDKKTGKAYEPADYFTNDKEDAISTARDMLRRASVAHVKTNPKARKRRNPDIHIDIGSHNATRSRKVQTNPAAISPNAVKLVPSGAWEISDIINNHLVRKTYYGLSKREAIRAFRTETKAMHSREMRANPMRKRRVRKNPEPARMRRKHITYQVQRSDDGKRWSRLADFPHTPDGAANAKLYAKAYHAAKRCMVRVID